MPHTTGRLRRIAWLEPARFPFGYDDQNIYSGVLFPRGGPKMAGLLQAHGYQVEVISGETSAIDPDDIAASFDLACVSVLSNTAPHGMVLARWLAERGLPVVMGGYQFAHHGFTPETLAPTDQALDFAPYVVRGEGYRALPQLLDALQGQASLQTVGGLSYRTPQGNTVHNPVHPLLGPEEVADLPLADWTCVRDLQHMRVASVHGLQGCPRSCTWCAVWRRDGRGLTRTPATRLVDELEGALAAGNFRHVFFSADNFPVIHTWAKEVCEEILRRGLRFSWTCQAEVGAIERRELVELMCQAGCERWCLGLESINERSLADCNKRQNRQAMEACIAELRRRGVHVHGMFIVGLPHDTPDTVRQTVAWAKRAGIETCQFLCLSDLPGSLDYETNRLWEHTFRPFEGAYEPLNWMFVNGHYARLGNEHMSVRDVQRSMMEAMRRFYSLGRALRPLAAIHGGAFRTALERGRGLLGGLREGYLHNLVTAYLRLRGHVILKRWGRSDFNRAYQELLEAAPERFEQVRERLLSHIPESWLQTLERVHEERQVGLSHQAGALQAQAAMGMSGGS